MSTKFYVIAVWTLLSFVVKVNAQDKVGNVGTGLS